MDKQQIISVFKEKFGAEEGVVYASPGRINLIGEYTDYNGGFVFPGAVQQESWITSISAPSERVRRYENEKKWRKICVRHFFLLPLQPILN